MDKFMKRLTIGAGATLGFASVAGVGFAVHNSKKRRLIREFEKAPVIVQKNNDTEAMLTEEFRKRREEKEKEFEALKQEIDVEFKKWQEMDITDPSNGWSEQLRKVHDLDMKVIYMLNHWND